MGKKVIDAVLDGAFDILDQCTEQYACSAEPTDRADAISLYQAKATMTANTDYTKANGDTSGRKVTMAAKSGVAIDGTTGTSNHIALCTATTLLYVTTCDAQVLTANGSNTVNFPAWDIEIADPA